jgi:hypothetical protein
MPRTPPEDLQTFLQRQDGSALVAVLLELAADHEAVQAHLTRLQLADRPDKLAAGFRKTLNGWRRSKRFMVSGEAREFGRTLETWLDQIARELMPKAPPTALELFQAFIEADAVFFECADDSVGAVGDAVRSGCRYWLQAASRCETPPGEWPGRVIDLFAADAYGAREELLRRADVLFDEAGQRAYRAVNTTLIELYWQIGEHISRKIAAAEWGDSVVDRLAAHIARSQPGLRGFTRRNLFRMRQFYEAYQPAEFVPPLVAQIP